MKKIFACFFLTAFCISAANADDGALVSRAATPERGQIAVTVPAASPATRTSITRNVVQKPIPIIATDTNAAALDADVENSQPATRGATPIQSHDSARSVATTARVGNARSVAPRDASNAREGGDLTIRNVVRGTRALDAGVNSTASAKRLGVTLRSSPESTDRAGASGTDSNSDVNKSRAVQSRAANTKETIAEATDRLQQTAGLNKSCQEQYNDCMDQFCAVIDANQKRCSCSSNLSRYTKVETAVKDANAQLNDVAQRIRYVGLSADEIRAIMSATEAELALTGTRDNTESRNMLEAIEKLIKNPNSATTYTGDSYTGLDMDLDFSADASDLFSLDFLGNATASFSNLRGTELYSAAKKRCNAVLNQCKNAGATVQQITGNYDLAIDKDCIAYEQGLGKMNDTLKTNVRSANQMLQKARLAVLQNKNQYDTKGCIGALNNCMIDDMVCGADYSKCLDPTKKYIDENGTVILGRRIADITDFMKSYNNAAINESFLGTAATQPMDKCKDPPPSGSTTGGNDGSCIVKYLLDKIGTGRTVNDGGLCRAVLDKCQRVSYDANGTYKKYNEVIVNYVQRAMVNIQAAQKQIISDYASSCMVDIANCYNQQVSQVNAWSSTASINSVYNVMRGACRNVALTCAYAVFADESTGLLCPTSGAEETCINNISKMFYQSLLCPDNSSYQPTDKDNASVSDQPKYVNDRCKCDPGYEVWGKTCTRECATNEYRENSFGTCKSCGAGTYLNNGDCTTCPVNNYCPAGATSATPCPSGTSSAGSKAVTDCT